MKAARRTPSTRQPIRVAVQLFFLLLVALVALNHTLEERGVSIPIVGSASTHSICPFGGVVSIYQYATAGTAVRKIHDSSFILMFAVLGLTLLVGPAFCGWVCPLGSVQEWIGNLGRRLLGKKYNSMIPRKLDQWLRYLRYGMLAWVLYVTARSATLAFSDYDPYYALLNFYTGEVAVSAMVILAVVLGLSLLVERPFCKYACPYGALLGVVGLLRVFGIKRNSSTCIDCGRCDTACPMNIEVSARETIRSHQCISCLKCTSEYTCPVVKTVELQVGSFQKEQGGYSA